MRRRPTVEGLEQRRAELLAEIGSLKRAIAAHRRRCLDYESRVADFAALERRGMLSPRPRR